MSDKWLRTTNSKEILKSASYQKPKLEHKTSMSFPKEIAEKFNAGKFCIQCSGCHGCR